MSAAEYFVSRWMRLKESSEFRRSADDTPRSAATEMSAAGAAVAQPAVAASFDPASLPPIETIGKSKDIASKKQNTNSGAETAKESCLQYLRGI